MMEMAAAARPCWKCGLPLMSFIHIFDGREFHPECNPAGGGTGSAPAPVAVEAVAYKARFFAGTDFSGQEMWSPWALHWAPDPGPSMGGRHESIALVPASALTALQSQVEALTREKDAALRLVKLSHKAMAVEKQMIRADAAEVDNARLRQRVEEMDADIEGMRLFLAGHPTFSQKDFAAMDKTLAADRARKEPNNV